QSTNNLLSFFFTDGTGHFTAGVTGTNQWKIGPDSASLPPLGYLPPQNKPKVNVGSSSVSGVAIGLPAATAIFYGTVQDGSGNPLAGVPLNAFDMNGQYNTDITTDPMGHYYLGIVGGLGANDQWQVQFDTSDLSVYDSYVFSQNSSTNVTV